ncbi:uncharacterized protein LOC110980469 [Acanthaster planci]|uniref:Uncharacterized protein LOC110980469 n=1 Tax=Acanthaster planci TaxID=133434 RepID=A0A8B7YHZ7_ACAPL|nr:uncharacterized protein LOC110980469 [Acanthaster planci]
MKFLLLLLSVVVVHAKLAPLHRSNHRSVPDSWIIKIEDFDQVDQVADDIVSQFARMRSPIPPMTKLRHVLPLIGMKIPSFLLDKIRAIDGIEYIEMDYIVPLAASQYNPPWNLDRTDSRLGMDGFYNYNASVQGKGVDIYLIDTGVQPNHVAFGGRVSLLYGAKDNDGHGTHCAGIAAGDVYGLAREANILSMKVCNPMCVTWKMLECFDLVLTHGGSKGGVVSVSIGGDPNYQVVTNAVNRLWHGGYLVSWAAGNENMDACRLHPQRGNNLIVAGASNKYDGLPGFTNWGPCVDIFAPGGDIRSARYSEHSNTDSIVYSGTSMSAPHVAGSAALYYGLQGSSATPASVKKAILDSSTKDALSNTKGSPNRLLYVNFLTNPATHQKIDKDEPAK